jgi:ATP-dependent Lon protease
LIRHTSDLFRAYVKESPNMTPDLVGAFDNIDDPDRKLYFAAANIRQDVEIKQRIMQKRTLKTQNLELATILNEEIDLLKIEDEIDSKINDSIQKTQKKYYIQEQIRALQDELGDEEDSTSELQEIRTAIEKAKMPKAVLKKAMEEFNKLKKTPAMSPDYSVNRTYLELLTDLPWYKRTTDDLDIEHVKQILDEDHWDLEKPKERILEFIAVLNMAGILKRQILCLSGPPGVGKTSLAKSVARALGRKFIRFSLGGVRDEAEIRGHRKTYVGAMPGKIIQSMKKAETVNPVILLDEIDKMSMDFRGDPSSALLEVLDPEQNANFNDHYVEVDYDLSSVMFITTANAVHEIPLPLQDRMEIIELGSYLDPDKLQIAKRHIIPKLKTEFGLDEYDISFSDEAIMKLIREYTRESGVRHLERALASVLRKLIKEIVKDYDKNRRKKATSAKRKALKDNTYFKRSMKDKKIVVDVSKVLELLKNPRFPDKEDETEDKVGVVTGLAWTRVGGEILPVEVTFMPGAEKLTLTGQLGDVMKESAQAALSFVRSNCKILGVPEDFRKKKEIHIHAPEGAIPKDGPSAGITMTIAIVSAATNRPVRGDIAMTGEITLRGNVLPIGGLTEKLLAAKRHGMKTVLIPFENKRDLGEIKEEIKKGLEIIPIKHATDALELVFRDKKKTNKKKTDK